MDKIADWIEIIAVFIFGIISLVGLFLIAHPVGWLILGVSFLKWMGII